MVPTVRITPTSRSTTSQERRCIATRKVPELAAISIVGFVLSRGTSSPQRQARRSLRSERALAIVGTIVVVATDASRIHVVVQRGDFVHVFVFCGHVGGGPGIPEAQRVFHPL